MCNAFLLAIRPPLDFNSVKFAPRSYVGVFALENNVLGKRYRAIIQRKVG